MMLIPYHSSWYMSHLNLDQYRYIGISYRSYRENRVFWTEKRNRPIRKKTHKMKIAVEVDTKDRLEPK